MFGSHADLLSYCMNVHGGGCYEDLERNLRQYAVRVRDLAYRGEGVMGVGLWLSDESMQDLMRDWSKVAGLKQLLGELGLKAVTLNGFPFGNFHQEIVKKKVYLPRWGERSRTVYTKHLIRLLVGLLDEDEDGSISTLPLGWRSDMGGGRLKLAAQQVCEMAEYLREVLYTTGKRVRLTLEPEPGCMLDRSTDVVVFFEKYLYGLVDEEIVREYVGVCHDVCHAAVMFEGQEEAWSRYEAAGIQVAKVQLSNAVKLEMAGLSWEDVAGSLRKLRSFSEKRYLHQCGVLSKDNQFRLYDDLPVMFNDPSALAQAREIRVHFHVPVFVEQLGLLSTTQDHLIKCLDLIKRKRAEKWQGDVEIETYAWHVLPPELRVKDLAVGIAHEMRCIQDYLSKPL